MKFKSLDKKRIENDKLRMTEPSVLFTKFQKILGTHTVNSDEVGRPDLISVKYYGSPDYVELILKWNNISNPFSIDTGDTLEIPDNDGAFKEWKPIKDIGVLDQDKNTIRDQFVNNKRLTVKDQKRIEYLQKKAAQKENGSKQILPPNILKNGDSNISINNDIITI